MSANLFAKAPQMCGGEISKAAVQGVLRAALSDDVTAIGGIAVAAQECGVSDDSIRRRLAGTHAWTDSDISALIAASHARLGRVLVTRRMDCLLSSGPPIFGDARRACDDITAAIPELLSEIQAMSAAVADRSVTKAEARQMLAQMPAARQHLDQVQSDLEAIVRDPGRP